MSSMPDQAGLKWVEGTWGEQQPRWTKEPSLDIVLQIACHHLGLATSPETTIAFLSQGGFNKLFKITCSIGNFVMRVSLPVDPFYKTASEVTTLDLIQHHTTIPVPTVIAHDASNENELGFEWILMEYVSGITLDEAWTTMTWLEKCKLVERIVDISSQLFRLRSETIGNIYRADDPVPNISDRSIPDDHGISSKYMMGRIVSMPFFWATRLSLDIHRGPFKSSTNWLMTRLALLKHDTEQPLPSDADSDDGEEIDLNREMITLLLQFMPHFFPADVEESEGFGLRHDDISRRNIMVEPYTGELTALVDWECVSMVPLWKVCQLPWVLISRERTTEPQKHRYTHEGNETDELYFIHLEEYEKTCLRQLFFEHMAKLEPAWMEVHRLSEAKADFDYAVENCDCEIHRKQIRTWLENVAAGKEQDSLRALMLK
ncbi:hypothetical protein HO133_008249 [Letharia lupina]|uniref:Aminoglycoside phosphotransferase domain-containing protein n=1 Tax=Letharia lupina TaxID=560253 RepID=A0A8H6CS78_9LECA|nr:uncharacterized protein HO133_008249 [Letharia lupina]KAF6228519.1 hypothetical protein HO133_008249 [Letharia lupina]